MQVKVSCIVCTYNYGRFLRRCLSSLLTQTLPREAYEVIIVDDGSTDDTSSVVAEFADAVRSIRLGHLGLAQASNTGVLSSRGEYFVRVDADDELERDGLAQLAMALDSHPRAAAVYSDRIELDSTGATRTVQNPAPPNIYELIAPGIMFRRARVLEAGLYRPYYWEEHDLMVRILQRYPVHHVRRPLYKYYLHGGNMTANDQARNDGWRELIGAWGIDELRRWGRSEELEQVYRQTAPPLGHPR